MPEIIHFIDPNKSSKITGLSFGPNGNNARITLNEDSLLSVSGINDIYDNRFKARSGTTSSSSSSTDALTLNGLSPNYYLDRANQSGNMNNLSVQNLQYIKASGTEYSQNGSGVTYINWANGNTQTVNLVSNTTLVLSGALTGSRLQLFVNQDSVGNRTVSYSGAAIKWANSTVPTLSTSGNAVDMLAFYNKNNTYYGTAATSFA